MPGEKAVPMQDSFFGSGCEGLAFLTYVRLARSGFGGFYGRREDAETV